MSTKRTPLNRPQRHRFTPKAIALFKQILDLSDDIFSTEYRRLDRELWRELQLRGVGQGCPCPVVITPDMVPCYPPATLGGHWQRVAGPALFRRYAQRPMCKLRRDQQKERRD